VRLSLLPPEDSGQPACSWAGQIGTREEEPA
jgi:hypothetical protein